MKRICAWAVCLAVLLTSLAGCFPEDPATTIDPSLLSATPTVGESSAPALHYSVSERDSDPSYETVAGTLSFSDNGVSVSGSGVSVTKTTATITAEGTYLVSGNCPDGAIVVNAPKDQKIQLVLNGLSLSSQAGAPLQIQQADKVFLTLAEGSHNTLADAGASADTDGVIFSKESLSINGSGMLTVRGNHKHGIVVKDELVITDGNLTVHAASTGIDGKDCVKITGGNITVNAGKNGIRSSGTDVGYIWISGGTIAMDSAADGLEAASVLLLDGGTCTIRTGGGSGRKIPGANVSGAKGLKSDGHIIVRGGTIAMDTADDAIHAGGNVYLHGGVLSVSSGDDGIHADALLEISGSVTHIAKSFEGLEATDVRITGGITTVVSTDDGMNAAGGKDTARNGGIPSSSFSGGDARIEITGGYLLLDASGDGIDANGTIEISGGTVLISGPTNQGNGTIDYDGSASITGGVLIACGPSGSTQNMSDGTQGSARVTIPTQSAGTTIALCGADGQAIVTFTAKKAFNNVVISAPGMAVGETYTLVSCKAKNTDENGFARDIPVTVIDTLAQIEMTSLIQGHQHGRP
ncbi:MAG: carbohydrate-binding domain-containing protein [Clostridia bacterium]|nr:carbohydrate-binding domain-containing protein [Clostridia bacterium]